MSDIEVVEISGLGTPIEVVEVGGVMDFPAAGINNSMLTDMAQNRIKGRVATGTGDPQDLTPAQTRTVIASDTAFSFFQFLRSDGTFASILPVYPSFATMKTIRTSPQDGEIGVTTDDGRLYIFRASAFSYPYAAGSPISAPANRWEVKDGWNLQGTTNANGDISVSAATLNLDGIIYA